MQGAVGTGALKGKLGFRSSPRWLDSRPELKGIEGRACQNDLLGRAKRRWREK
jgi:hypothetical protein